MDKTILISIPVEDLQTLIVDSVSECLKFHESSKNEKKDSNELLNITQASELLGLALPTLYALTSSRRIPHSRKGKKLYFSKTELTEWVKSGKRKTVSEIETEAENFTSKKK